jgi:hypothetical protein
MGRAVSNETLGAGLFCSPAARVCTGSARAEHARSSEGPRNRSRARRKGHACTYSPSLQGCAARRARRSAPTGRPQDAEASFAGWRRSCGENVGTPAARRKRACRASPQRSRTDVRTAVKALHTAAFCLYQYSRNEWRPHCRSRSRGGRGYGGLSIARACAFGGAQRSGRAPCVAKEAPDLVSERGNQPPHDRCKQLARGALAVVEQGRHRRRGRG